MLLGCIADDLTGATDLAINLRATGLQVLQVNGVPPADLVLPPADAIVVALKSRTIAARAACAQSLAALRWLQQRGAERIVFKICSTFDSTAAGNIGPVTDALIDALLDAPRGSPRGSRLEAADADPRLRTTPLPVVCTPAYPRNQRTVYQGHLFVGEVLLSDSGMRTHPLTPMTEANLVRVLQAQTPHKVGLLPLQALQQGEDAVRVALHAAAQDGVRHLIADAIEDAHLDTLAHALVTAPLVVGGAGLGRAVGAVFCAALGRARASGAMAQSSPAQPPPVAPAIGGPIAILAGSCSEATLAQLQAVEGAWTAVTVDAEALMRDRRSETARVIAAVLCALAADLAHRGKDGKAASDANDDAHSSDSMHGVVVVRASLSAAELQQVQQRHGAAAAAHAVEAAFRAVAQALAADGVRRFVVAGGETSGAVSEALGVRALVFGDEIAPGVPWTVSSDGRYALALKSGNFGGSDFLRRAVNCAP